MYAAQSAAFSARDVLLGRKTDSTSDSPPSFTSPNLEELCSLKKKVLAELPTHCIHCDAEYTKKSFVETKDGAVMAYCKQPGACGKSLVLFAGVDLSTPIYIRVCMFQKLTQSQEPI
jgi:hypothetical protein